MAEISKPDYSYLWSSGGAIVSPSNVKIQTGWTAEVPPFQWENWSQNRQDQAIAHVLQHGISVWDAVTEYQAGKSYVTGSNGKLYVAITTNTNNNPTTDTLEVNWADVLKPNLVVITTTGVTSWTVPTILKSGLRRPKVIVTGAGGSGAGGGAGIRGAGGGAGGSAIGFVDLTGVSTVSVTVGAAGVGGTSGGASGFGGFLSAVGGTAGSGISGGAGGTAAGGLTVTGGAGADGNPSVYSANSVGGGNGGPSLWGGGTRGSTGAGTSGNAAYGSGGGGSETIGNSGIQGVIVIEW